MTYPFRPPPRPKPPPVNPLPPPFPDGMLSEFADRPYGSTGMWFSGGPGEPGITFVPRPQIPPPDWDEERREREARERAERLAEAGALGKENESALAEEQPSYPPPRREPA